MYAKELRERVLDALEAVRIQGLEWLEAEKRHPQVKSLYTAIKAGLYTGCLKDEELKEAEKMYQERVIPLLQKELNALQAEVRLLKSKRRDSLEKRAEEKRWLNSLDQIDIPPPKPLKRKKQEIRANTSDYDDSTFLHDEGTYLLEP